MFTLTFEEYLKMKEFYGIPADPDLTKELDSYILEGGFPKALEYRNISDKRRYVDSVIQEIYKKDISNRKKINNKEVFCDILPPPSHTLRGGASRSRTPVCSDNPSLSDPLCPRVPLFISLHYRSAILSASVFRLIAALWSLSWCTPHTGQSHSRTARFLVMGETFPQQEHI